MLENNRLYRTKCILCQFENVVKCKKEYVIINFVNDKKH